MENKKRELLSKTKGGFPLFRRSKDRDLVLRGPGQENPAGRILDSQVFFPAGRTLMNPPGEWEYWASEEYARYKKILNRKRQEIVSFEKKTPTYIGSDRKGEVSLYLDEESGSVLLKVFFPEPGYYGNPWEGKKIILYKEAEKVVGLLGEDFSPAFFSRWASPKALALAGVL